jgi:hypothetical protein
MSRETGCLDAPGRSDGLVVLSVLSDEEVNTIRDEAEHAGCVRSQEGGPRKAVPERAPSRRIGRIVGFRHGVRARRMPAIIHRSWGPKKLR